MSFEFQCGHFCHFESCSLGILLYLKVAVRLWLHIRELQCSSGFRFEHCSVVFGYGLERCSEGMARGWYLQRRYSYVQAWF